jgi:hypothetical protein
VPLSSIFPFQGGKGGFSFLGYDFNQDGLIGVAEPTRKQFVERLYQLL